MDHEKPKSSLNFIATTHRDRYCFSTKAIQTENLVLLISTHAARIAWLLAQLGETKESLNHVRHCAELLAVQSYVHFGGLPYVDLGRACLILGRLDEAQHFGERRVELLSGNLGFRSKALQLVGDIVTHPERFDAERGEAH